MCNTFIVEMWAMLYELELIWKENIIPLVVESNSKVLIDIFCQEHVDDHIFSTLICRNRKMNLTRLLGQIQPYMA